MREFETMNLQSLEFLTTSLGSVVIWGAKIPKKQTQGACEGNHVGMVSRDERKMTFPSPRFTIRHTSINIKKSCWSKAKERSQIATKPNNGPWLEPKFSIIFYLVQIYYNSPWEAGYPTESRFYPVLKLLAKMGRTKQVAFD